MNALNPDFWIVESELNWRTRVSAFEIKLKPDGTYGFNIMIKTLENKISFNKRFGDKNEED